MKNKNRINKYLQCFLRIFIALTLPLSVLAAPPVIGHWKTIDDTTGKEKSIVEIYESGGKINGRVTNLISPSEPNPVCTKCDPPQKDKPIIGLQIIFDLSQDDDQQWSGGKILDPQNGKLYKCRLRLQKNGSELEVRGYIGFSLIGRSQIWKREASPSLIATPEKEPPATTLPSH